MKIFLLGILLSLWLFSKTIDCIVSPNLVTKVKPLFNDIIAYNKLQIRVQTAVDDREVLKVLMKNDKAKFAIIRRDILWQIAQSTHTLKPSYILLSELPFSAMLYLVQDEDSFDVDLDSLEKKKVSIGSLGGFNNLYLKTLMDKKHMKYSILYKSLTYEQSMHAFTTGNIDAYFGFLFPSQESNDLHFQTLFSENTVTYFKNKHIFEIDYNGISSPYILVADTTADDAEIESIIYRLMEKELFVPVTDERFGTINRYVLNHLEQVEKVLKSTYESLKINQGDIRSDVCRKYHYGFLKLLRQKPRWKKNLKRLGNPQKRKKFMQAFNRILLDIESKKKYCDLAFLKTQKMKFNRLKGKINYTTKH